MLDNISIYIILPAAFAIGVAVGSFVTLASFRLPRGEEIVIRPSYCPHCHATLSARELVPLLSWLMQRMRCLHCRAPISIRYPLIELALGLIFALLTLRWGLGRDLVLLCLLATALAILIVTDLEHTIIPDSVQIALIALAFAWHLWHHAPILPQLAGASGGLVLGLLLHYGYLILRKKDALGWADVKFFAVAGFWLAPTSYVMFLLIAGVAGTCTGLLWRMLSRGAVFPFGPALAISLFINVLFPDILPRVIM